MLVNLWFFSFLIPLISSMFPTLFLLLMTPVLYVFVLGTIHFPHLPNMFVFHHSGAGKWGSWESAFLTSSPSNSDASKMGELVFEAHIRNVALPFMAFPSLSHAPLVCTV